MPGKPIPLNDILNSPLNKPKEEAGSLRTFILSSIDKQKKVDPYMPTYVPVDRSSELPNEDVPANEIIVIPEPVKPASASPTAMKVHIRINKRTPSTTLDIEADFGSIEELNAFHEKYGYMMPRKKLWGLL
jgi:hypothetical protein